MEFYESCKGENDLRTGSANPHRMDNVAVPLGLATCWPTRARSPGVLNLGFGSVASVVVVAPEDRTLWMHAAVTMVRCNGIGNIRNHWLRSALSPPGYRTARCMPTPREVAIAFIRLRFSDETPLKKLMASLISPCKSVCCFRYAFNVARSMTSVATMFFSESAAGGTGNSAGRLAKTKVASRPFSFEMACRKCLRTASRSSSVVAEDLRGTVIPCAAYNFLMACLSKWLLHSRTCFKSLLHCGCACCARRQSIKP